MSRRKVIFDVYKRTASPKRGLAMNQKNLVKVGD